MSPDKPRPREEACNESRTADHIRSKEANGSVLRPAFSIPVRRLDQLDPLTISLVA